MIGSRAEKHSLSMTCPSLLQILEGPPSSARDSGGAVTGGGPDHGSRTGRDRHSHAGFSDARRRRDDRALDKDEEDYFNEDRYPMLHSNVGNRLRFRNIVSTQILVVEIHVM